MEISRDGRRVPELIDTSAPRSGGGIYTQTGRRGRETSRVGKGERERERETERDIYGSLRTARVNWSRVSGPEFARITRDLADSASSRSS